MKTNKRDKGIKGKPTQDINTCNKFYYEVLRDYTSTITQYTERIYLTKSEKKAMKLINSCRKQGIDPNTSYCLIKIEVSEVKNKNDLGVLIKELKRVFFR